MNEPPDYDSSPAYVMDASALLAFSHGEEGAATVGPLLGSSVISSVNWEKTVKDYLKYMNYYRRELKNNSQSIETFRIVLITEIEIKAPIK